MILNPWQPSLCLYVKYNKQSSWEMKSGWERNEAHAGGKEWEWHVDSAHLDDFVIAAVRFLRVQVYETDLERRQKSNDEKSQCEDYSPKAEQE